MSAMHRTNEETGIGMARARTTGILQPGNRNRSVFCTTGGTRRPPHKALPNNISLPIQGFIKNRSGFGTRKARKNRKST
jgi:hypothetical protein